MGGGGCHRGADGEEGGLVAVGGGATARWGAGVGAIKGGQQWGCVQPLKTALHTIST